MDKTIESLPPIFAACTADEDARYEISKPWVQAGYVGATDGRVIVRTMLEGADAGKGPNMDSLPWDPALYADTETPLPDIGKRPGVTVCEECGGIGLVTCPCCEREHECDECGGSGEAEARRTPFALPNADYPVSLMNNYIWLLQEHGVTGVFLRRTPPPRGVSQSVRFVVGDVEGLLMPAADED